MLCVEDPLAVASAALAFLARLVAGDAAITAGLALLANLTARGRLSDHARSAGRRHGTRRCEAKS